MTASNKIKILFRHRSMEMGGVEKVLLSLVNNLNPDKFEMTVCLNLNQGELRDEFPPHVRKVVLAPGKEDFSRNPIIQKIQLAKRKLLLEKLRKQPKIVDKKFLKEEYDIEIAMSYGDFESVLNSTNRNSKKIGWFHSEINVPKLQPLVPKILEHFPQFDQLIYCSQRIMDLMHEHYPDLDYPPEKVIINVIPIEDIRRNAQQPIDDFPLQDNPIFVAIGRLHSRKGFHKLMDAHAKLLSEGLRHKVLVIGDGEEYQNLLNQKEKLKVNETFILLGGRMNPYPYLKKADFFIMPSESEAWPLVLAEALILKKPVIATNTGDVQSMIKDRQTGYLISYSTDEIYKAMKAFLTDVEMIRAINNNLRDIDRQFDSRKIFQEVEDIFLKLTHS